MEEKMCKKRNRDADSVSWTVWRIFLSSASADAWGRDTREPLTLVLDLCLRSQEGRGPALGQGVSILGDLGPGICNFFKKEH